MFNRIIAAQECNATGVDSSYADDYIKIFLSNFAE